MKEVINQRFIDAIHHLITESRGLKKSGIAAALNIKPNTFSEILNKRMGIGVDTVALLCDEYGISVEWLIRGKGEMFSQDVYKTKNTPIPTKPNNDYLMEIQKDLINIQKNRIVSLEDEIRKMEEIIKLKSEIISELEIHPRASKTYKRNPNDLTRPI